MGSEWLIKPVLILSAAATMGLVGQGGSGQSSQTPLGLGVACAQGTCKAMNQVTCYPGAPYPPNDNSFWCTDKC